MFNIILFPAGDRAQRCAQPALRLISKIDFICNQLLAGDAITPLHAGMFCLGMFAVRISLVLTYLRDKL